MTDYEAELASRLRRRAESTESEADAPLLEEAASTIERLAEESPFVRLGRKLAVLEGAPVTPVPTDRALAAMGLREGHEEGTVDLAPRPGDQGPSEGHDGPVTVYTDGACSRGGIGGWAWWQSPAASGSGAEHFTTNNQMELWSVIEALGAWAPDVPLRIVSDSSYVVNAFAEDWFGKWRANGWRNSKKEPVENRELWEELLAQVQAHRASIEWVHTRGHGKGAPEHKHGNGQADKLAVQARLDLAGEHDRRGEEHWGEQWR